MLMNKHEYFQYFLLIHAIESYFKNYSYNNISCHMLWKHPKSFILCRKTNIKLLPQARK